MKIPINIEVTLNNMEIEDLIDTVIVELLEYTLPTYEQEMALEHCQIAFDYLTGKKKL